MHEFINGGAPRPNIRAVIERDPPHDYDAERELIAGICLGGSAVLDMVCAHVGASDFYVDLHSRLFATALAVCGNGRRPTSAVILKLADDERRYLGGCIITSPAMRLPFDAVSRAVRICDMARRRRFIAIMNNGPEDAYDLTKPLASTIDHTLAALAQVDGAFKHNTREPSA